MPKTRNNLDVDIQEEITETKRAWIEVLSWMSEVEGRKRYPFFYLARAYDLAAEIERLEGLIAGFPCYDSWPRDCVEEKQCPSCAALANRKEKL